MSAEFKGLRPSPSDIRIGRLLKRIRKLTDQRDHYRTELVKLEEILRLYPYMRNHVSNWKERQAKSDRLRELEATQTILVRELERYKSKPKGDDT